MTFSLFTVFLLHIFRFLADFSRCPVPGAKNVLVRKTSLYENGHNFISVYDINILSADKSCANTLALIWSLYELKILTQSKDMAEKQNPSRIWYISRTFITSMYGLPLNVPLSSTVKLWPIERFVLQFENENVIFQDSYLFNQSKEIENPNFRIARKAYLKVLQVRENPRRPFQLHNSKDITSLKVNLSVEFIMTGSNNKTLHTYKCL